MSSVSSFEGSDKDSFFQRSFMDGTARHSYLRKTDFLDNLDVSRLRDTDAWSVAATIDDQESVKSNQAGPKIDDDRSTVDGETSVREQLQGLSLNKIETLRDLVDGHQLRSAASIDDDEDKRSRSNAAEFGDDAATGDFDHSVASDIVDDQIMAPPQPQPSFASETKTYSELLEENEILTSQLRDAQMAQKHQDVLISNLKNLTNCDEELFGKALDLSQTKAQELDTPIINARTLTHRLAQLAESLTRFVNASVEPEWRLQLEQSLFAHITESYLTALPFGTENQDLLNTAYSDQISRFHNTLGANFAKWYRRQTVQSLSLNHATKEYLQDMHTHLTKEMLRQVDSNSQMHLWQDILDLCAALSLEIHGGDADVSTQTIAVGTKFNQEIMTVVNDDSSKQEKVVKMVISPLFIDEEDSVLLPARVVLE